MLERSQSNGFFDEPVGEAFGAYKTAYLSNLAELVTGDRINGLSAEEEPESIVDVEDGHHYDKNEVISLYFSELMRDKKVLDLGCGVQGAGYKIANFAKAKEYVGVEKNFGSSALEKTSEMASDGSIPFQIVQQDMVKYVQESSHQADIVIMVGIDLTIIPEEKWDDLLHGISNMMPEDGYFLLGGGVSKPWQIVEKYFRKDTKLEEIERSDVVLMSATIPSVWRKRKVPSKNKVSR